jgi:energy-coupling factor transporter ATP-binding protein EcfA2
MQDNETLKKLQKLSEHDLVEKILIPLLTKLGFENIEVRHGPMERGVDLLCFKIDEFGDLDLLAVQAKRINFSGNSASMGHPHALLTQISQCFKEPIKLKNGVMRKANRIWFISPYELNAPALESSFQGIADSITNRIKIIDGPKLLIQIRGSAPEILAELGDKRLVYIERLRAEIHEVAEATAFKLNKSFSLLPTHVNLDGSLGTRQLARIALGRFEPQNSKEILMHLLERKRLEHFINLTQNILHVTPFIKSNRKIDEAGKFLYKVDSHHFFEAVKKLISGAVCDAFSNEGKWIATELCKIHELTSMLHPILSNDYIQHLLKPKLQFSNKKQLRLTREIDLVQLITSNLNVQVIGHAGAGKTTMLRMIAYLAAEASQSSNRLPVFVPLTNLKPNESLEHLILASLGHYGYNATKQALQKLLFAGSLIVLFDGIDEAVYRVSVVKDQIIRFLQTYKQTQCIITSRPLAALQDSPEFLTIAIEPFDNAKIRSFFRNWFANEPTKAQNVIDHLKKHEHVAKIVSNPLVATIFAVIQSYGSRLPTSSTELYEERLRLLLHDWDSAKGIRRDNFNLPDKLYFLRKLSYNLHRAKLRETSLETMIRIAMNHIGETSTERIAKEFVIELIRNNNILYQTTTGNWTLGHLQYQEHLAALELKENQRINIYLLLDDSWWHSVLRFYAMMTRDISNLLQKATGDSEYKRNIYILHELLLLAPNTEKSLRDFLQEEWLTLSITNDPFGFRALDIQKGEAIEMEDIRIVSD